jgi:hypothetical protein
MTDFMNLKIKLAQFFRCVHSDRLYVYIFIGVSDYIYIYINICVCTVFLTKHACMEALRGPYILWHDDILAVCTGLVRLDFFYRASIIFSEKNDGPYKQLKTLSQQCRHSASHLLIFCFPVDNN